MDGLIQELQQADREIEVKKVEVNSDNAPKFMERDLQTLDELKAIFEETRRRFDK